MDPTEIKANTIALLVMLLISRSDQQQEESTTNPNRAVKTGLSPLRFAEIQGLASMRTLAIAVLTGASALALGAAPLQAQVNKQPTPAQLAGQFRDGFMKGCLNGKTPDVKNQRGYCDCLANAYQKRYDGTTLAVISQAAGSLGEKDPALVNLMMSPESKTCVARF